MALPLKPNCRLAIVTMLLLFVSHSISFNFMHPMAKGMSAYSCVVHWDSVSGLRSLTAISDASSIEQRSQRTQSTDLTTLIRLPPVDQSGIYTQAVDLLSSMQSAPSCNRLAALTLMNSCQSIEGSNPNSEASLDDIRSIYAAQLAMCEIESAGSDIPQSCARLAHHPESKTPLSDSLKLIPKGQLSRCLQSLESRPQWWTSYSNNRQSAVIMCKASRVDIDKGLCALSHVLKLY